MTCDQFQEELELYALGVLENTEATPLADHLATGCPNCHEALQRALAQNLAVSSSVPLVEPPARLRRRVQEAIVPSVGRQRQWIPWALLAAVAVLTIAVGFTLQMRLRHQTQIAQSQSIDRARLSETLQILRAPGTRQVSITDPKLPDVHGAVYIHQQLGLALVIDRLPAAPAGWKYESWLVPNTGTPRPVEPFHPDTSGHAVSVVPGPLQIADVGAIAVSMEPEDSHPTKPTTLVFAAKI